MGRSAHGAAREWIGVRVLVCLGAGAGGILRRSRRRPIENLQARRSGSAGDQEGESNVPLSVLAGAEGRGGGPGRGPSRGGGNRGGADGRNRPSTEERNARDGRWNAYRSGCAKRQHANREGAYPERRDLPFCRSRAGGQRAPERGLLHRSSSG